MSGTEISSDQVVLERAHEDLVAEQGEVVADARGRSPGRAVHAEQRQARRPRPRDRGRPGRSRGARARRTATAAARSLRGARLPRGARPGDPASAPTSRRFRRPYFLIHLRKFSTACGVSCRHFSMMVSWSCRALAPRSSPRRTGAGSRRSCPARPGCSGMKFSRFGPGVRLDPFEDLLHLRDGDLRGVEAVVGGEHPRGRVPGVQPLRGVHEHEEVGGLLLHLGPGGDPEALCGHRVGGRQLALAPHRDRMTPKFSSPTCLIQPG